MGKPGGAKLSQPSRVFGIFAGLQGAQGHSWGTPWWRCRWEDRRCSTGAWQSSASGWDVRRAGVLRASPDQDTDPLVM